MAESELCYSYNRGLRRFHGGIWIWCGPSDFSKFLYPLHQPVIGYELSWGKGHELG